MAKKLQKNKLNSLDFEAASNQNQKTSKEEQCSFDELNTAEKQLDDIKKMYERQLEEIDILKSKKLKKYNDSMLKNNKFGKKT